MSGHPADEIDIVLRQFNLMKTDWEVTACRSKVYSTALRKWEEAQYHHNYTLLETVAPGRWDNEFLFV